MQAQEFNQGDIVEIIESKEVTSDFYVNPVGATGEIIQLSSFGTAYVKIKGYSEVFNFKLVQLKKKHTNYKIYKNSQLQCFVKYHDQPEKEITNHEYEELLQFKNRMLDAKIKEPVIYEQKEKEYSILAFSSTEYTPARLLKYDPEKDEFGAYNFIFETCKGKYYETNNSFVINSINNEDKGNGAFTELIDLIKNTMKQQYLVIENIYNPNLILNLEKNHGFKKITNTVCLWMRHFS